MTVPEVISRSNSGRPAAMSSMQFASVGRVTAVTPSGIVNGRSSSFFTPDRSLAARYAGV
jgi:hypothetical protein